METTTTTTAPSPQDRPEITSREVSWHATIAAIRARRAAESTSGRPEAITALAHAAAIPASLALPCVTIGHLWAFEALEPMLPGLITTRLADVALTAAVLRHGEEALFLALAGDGPGLAEFLLDAGQLAAEDAIRLDRWFSEEMARLKAITGGAQSEQTLEKKKAWVSSPPSAAAPATHPAGPSEW